MAEDLTLGEIARNHARLEARFERSLKDLDDRLTNLARGVVPTELWKAEHQSLQDDVKELRDEVRKAIHDAAERWNNTSLERRSVLDGKIDELAKRLDSHEEAHADRSAWSRSRTLQAIGIAVTAAAAIAAAWIGALLAAKGVH